MPRLVLPIATIVVGVSLAVGAAAIAQDLTTPAHGEPATPSATRCDRTAQAGGTPVVDGDCATPRAGTPAAMGDAAEAVTSVEIRFVDVAFVPKEVTIPADTDVTITFVNDGATTHDFKIAHPDVFSGYLAPGGTARVVVNLPAGTYPFACTIPGHAASGMSGSLIVREAAAVGDE